MQFCFPFLIFNKDIPFSRYKFLYYICFMLNNSYAIKRIAMSRFIIMSVSLFFLFIYTSCNRNGYTLNGSVAHSFFNGDSVYVLSMSADSGTVSSKGVVERGKFSLSGDAGSTDVAMLYISHNPVMPLVVEPGEITVSVGTDGISVKGTPLNNELGRFIAVKDSFDIAMTDILRKEARMLMEGFSADEARLAVQQEFAVAAAGFEEYIDSFVRSHYNDVLGPFVLAVYCGGMNYGMLNSKIQSLINDAPESFRNNRFVESLRMPMNDR